MPQELREMTYLKGLCSKYSSRLLYRYFDFTLTELARLSGMSIFHFSQVLHGRKRFMPTQEEAFKQAFKNLKIEEQTKDFKESEDQLWLKQHWAGQARLVFILFFLTTQLVFANMLDMEQNKTTNPTALKTAGSFFYPHSVKCLEYIFSTGKSGYLLVNQFKGIISAMGIIPLFFALVSLIKRTLSINLNQSRFGFFYLY